MNWQNLLIKLAMQAARGGMSKMARAIPSEPLRRAEPVPPPPVDDDQMRLHFFSADFPDPAAAHAFCYAPRGTDLPVQLTVELSGAMIDLAEVELITGDIQTRLLEFLTTPEADDILLRMGADNTVILITENAFGGLAYELDDTDTLTYLGPLVVSA